MMSRRSIVAQLLRGGTRWLWIGAKKHRVACSEVDFPASVVRGPFCTIASEGRGFEVPLAEALSPMTKRMIIKHLMMFLIYRKQELDAMLEHIQWRLELSGGTTKHCLPWRMTQLVLRCHGKTLSTFDGGDGVSKEYELSALASKNC